jgi:hypothetical protein
MNSAAGGRLGATLIAIGVGLLAAACSASLDDLTQRHRATGPPPTGVEDGGRVYLISPRHIGSDGFTSGTNGTGLRSAFTADGVFMEFGSFFMKKAVWIPTASIAGCSRSRAVNGQRPWRTNLWVEDSQVLIRVSDDRSVVAKWCTARGLKMSDEAMEGTWLRNPGRAGRLP